MTKLLKILGNITLSTVEILMIFIIALAFLIRTSKFQTYLAHKGTEYLSEMIDSKVSIGKVDIAFIDGVYFDQLYLEDQHQDTLAYIEEFYVNYSLIGALMLNFNIDKVEIKQARFALKRYKDEEKLNLQFLIDAFKPEQPSDKKIDFAININKVKIINSHFSYHDENKKPVEFGVDYANLDVKNIALTASNVVIKPEGYKAHLESVAFQERSGFDLNNLSAKAMFNDNGLAMGETTIITKSSDIHIKSFKLHSNKLTDFTDFVDLVKLESEFDTSYVSLKDVSYFAPQLKGMDDIIVLTGSTEKAVKELALNDIYLKYGRGTIVRGDFSLPDFKTLSKSNIHQKLDYLSLNVDDLERLKLPDNSSVTYIKWPTSLKALKHIEATNLFVNGSIHDLNVEMSRLNTNIGSFEFQEEFRVLSDTSYASFTIIPKNKSKSQFKATNIALNELLNDNNYGRLNGVFGLTSAEIDNKGFRANGVSGVLTNTELYSYSYDYIILDNLNYTIDKTKRETQNEAEGNIYIRDNNFDLSFNGFFSIGNYLEMKAEIDMECARLDEINPIFENRGELSTSIKVDAKGRNFNDFKGNLIIDSLFYHEGKDFFQTTNFNGFVERTKNKDSISIQSDFVDANLNGVVDYTKVGENISFQLGKIFPAFNISAEEDVNDELTHFKYDIKIKNINPILNVLYSSLQIAPQTRIDGYYNGSKNALGLNISANYIAYDSIRLNDIYAIQEVSNQELLALIDVNTISINDSLAFKKIHFTGLAANGGLDSQLLFEDPSDSKSNIEWFTNLHEKSEFDIDIFPSYITLNGHQWNLNEKAHINYSDSCFFIDGLKLEHENQYISANGQLSNSNFDRLYLDIMDLDLNELGNVLGADTKLSGIVNVSGYMTTPLSNLQFYGEAIIEDLHINKTDVGNVSFGANYRSNEDKINMFGDIFYRNEQTFQFKGDYFLKEREDSDDHLDFNMKFNHTDIAVVNEFLDPDVISDLKGNLNGELKLTGTLKDPVLTGKVGFDDGMINLAILGANMYFEGEIESVKDGVYINQMPVMDQEGNTGFITGSLFHNNFKDFYFEVIVNLEDHPTRRLPNDRSKPMPIERFLVMNTTYDIDNPYYGDAYITGIANISGFADNLSIVVNAKTKRGTKIVFPMYGPTTIEEDGFISFKKDGNQDEEDEKKIDLTGVDLQLNFDVTDDAEVKLIFDEKIGDEISAKGKGNLSLTVDQFNDLAMDGTYTVASGVYNFAMGPYKQNFNIQPGGTVQWAGDPYEAILNINAYYKTMANLSVVMPNVVDNQSSSNEEIYSYLNLTGNMMSPEISFDIEAPKASESGKAVISRIRSDKDELNKQFFSILISKSFMPLSGQGGGSGGNSGAFLDLASTQINNILNNMAEGYKMNVNLESDDFSGQFSGEFGVSKAFLDNRLLVSGSFGVGTTKGENGASDNVPSQNQFIGDVKIEYLLNEHGTFRMNVFNESNNNTVLQNDARGQFTQGVGVSYKEDFHTLEDFKLFQFFANIFRKKKNWVDLHDKKDNKVPIPDEYRKGNAIKNEE
ncbi:MAG TPA: translocation/assembly module TamB domain-containing protein [Brumimicrobium sp.]|nr:translocation/assembly module TamB domain-containing protein [Brumimicrobium sp.]